MDITGWVTGNVAADPVVVDTVAYAKAVWDDGGEAWAASPRLTAGLVRVLVDRTLWLMAAYAGSLYKSWRACPLVLAR